MRRRDRTGAGLAVFALLVLVPGGVDWAATDQDPLEEAAKATDEVDFSAQVSVKWLDRGRLYQAPVEVRSGDGRVHIGGPMEVVLGPTGLPGLRPERWLRVWPRASAGGRVPDVEDKYDLHRQVGPVIGGRPTHLWVLSVGGRLREQLAVDEATGLVLRRQLFGPAGEVVREVVVHRLDTGVAPEDGSPPAGEGPELRAVRPGRLPALYRAPESLAGGYRRVGAYHGDGQVHLLYSDGLHSMSLFVQPGHLSELTDGGRPVRVGRASGLRYGLPGGEVVAWEAGSTVRLLVSDAPTDEVLAAARSVPEPEGLSWAARLRRACRRVAEAVSGGP
ncbi:MAG TPA: hypothetical protein VHE80_11710 [Acidimicrobiales bacterium]|nr:hypothetical protein [Acidimicrobiales bacterium]